MCYASEAQPPFYGTPLVSISTRQVVLTSRDGTALAAVVAQPERQLGVGVLVLPDNRGLSSFYERLTERLAEQGHPALAIDYFGRTAGVDYAARRPAFDDLDTVMPHLTALTRDGVGDDILAGLAYLRGVEAAHGGGLVSFGFCLGGRFAFYTSGARFGLSGAIGLYGFPDELNGAPGPTQLADTFAAPILGVFGGADEGIPPATVSTFDVALTRAGVEHEFVTYPGAPHGFFESEQHEFADASADVWRRALTFLAERSR